MAASAITKMLIESNAIEGVYDNQSLQDAKEAWKYLSRFETINTQLIKYTHAILMKHQDIDYRHKGNWRDVPVWIGSEKKNDPPLIIEEKIKQLCKKMMSKRKLDPVKLHVEFEKIHPFIDGNGRMGRIIMNWHSIIRNGDKPITFTEAGRQTYYKIFQPKTEDKLERYMNRMDEYKQMMEDARNA